MQVLDLSFVLWKSMLMCCTFQEPCEGDGGVLA